MCVSLTQKKWKTAFKRKNLLTQVFDPQQSQWDIRGGGIYLINGVNLTQSQWFSCSDMEEEVICLIWPLSPKSRHHPVQIAINMSRKKQPFLNMKESYRLAAPCPCKNWLQVWEHVHAICSFTHTIIILRIQSTPQFKIEIICKICSLLWLHLTGIGVH